MFSCFSQAYNKESNLLDPRNEIWIDLVKQIPKTTTKWEYLKEPKKTNSLRHLCYRVAISQKTEFIVTTLTFLNLIVLAIEFEDSPSLLVMIMDYINLIIIMTIILEAIVKMIGLKITGYFITSWNRFDFFIALASIVDVYFTLSTDTSIRKDLLKNFQILRILRMIRAIR